MTLSFVIFKTAGSYSDKWSVEPINYFMVGLEGNADTSATQRNVKTVTVTYGGLTASGPICSELDCILIWLRPLWGSRMS